MIEALAAALLSLLCLEAMFRIRMLWFSPWKIKLTYVLFLLRRKRLAENNATNQRVLRGGFRSEAELFSHYAKISGKSETEIYAKFGRERSWLSLLSGEYYSGGHAVIDLVQRMHTGVAAAPNQRLQTLETDEHGFRRTGWDNPSEQVTEMDKVCLLLGGSAAFGVGSTSDEASIAGRLGHYLNLESDTRFVVVNEAMLSYNSHQELLTLLQTKHLPDYVISLSGYNELLQFSDAKDKVAANGKASERELVVSVLRSISMIVSSLTRRSIVLAELRRFMVAFAQYDEVRSRSEDLDPDVNIYPMR